MLWRIATAYACGLLAPAPVGVVTLLALPCRCDGRRWASGLVPALALAAMLGALDRHRASPEADAPRPVRVEGWVASAPIRGPGGFAAWLEVEALDGTRCDAAWRGAQLWVRCSRPLPAYGTRLVAPGTLQPPGAPRNFGAADPRR